uniref:Uncharacterized protein n=1 Tax=Pipistrellus kuhlii TaxID=59472 RepID=A0A7J7V0L1_PIPKU|nr:hypothetical protein mPipKuh1_008661 [Pipistrellus kuhlii]
MHSFPHTEYLRWTAVNVKQPCWVCFSNSVCSDGRVGKPSPFPAFSQSVRAFPESEWFWWPSSLRGDRGVQKHKAKVTRRPAFGGTVPIFNNLSRVPRPTAFYLFIYLFIYYYYFKKKLLNFFC